MAAEAELEKYLLRRVKELGGDTRKVRWIGRNGAPDRLVLLPEGYAQRGSDYTGYRPAPATAFFVELKAPGKQPTAAQRYEHGQLQSYGLRVAVVDSIDEIERILK